MKINSILKKEGNSYVWSISWKFIKIY
jgi:hypothetical protein